MGMFDTIHYVCPICGDRFSQQTKVGDCALDNYTPESAPDWVLNQLNGLKLVCSNGHQLRLKVTSVVMAEVCPDVDEGGEDA
jgi:hypothetical protein